MAEHACSVFLYISDAPAVKEFRIFLSVAVKEVVCSDSEPEEIDLLVGLLCIVIDLRKCHACERAV